MLDILSERLEIEKTEANSKFTNTFSRTDYFEKISDAPVKYQFTKSGRLKYAALEKLKESGKDFDSAVETFIKNYYWEELLKCLLEEREYLEIDYYKIWIGFPYFKDLLEKAPDEAISKFNKALEKLSVPADVEKWPAISIYNTGDILQVEDIKTQHIGRFVEVEGRIVVQSMTKSKIIYAAFKCQRCEDITYIPQEVGKFIEPFECQNVECGRKGPFKLLDPPESDFVDGQDIIIESLRGGQIAVFASMRGSLCRPPWERDAKVVRICGIVRKIQCATKAGKSPTFDWVIDVNSIRFADDSNTEPPTDDEIKLFEEWAKNPLELRKKLLESIAPNIDGLFDIKDACSLSWFSDWNWQYDPREVIERSSIHVLLFGDPGVAKSQIIKDVVFLAPKGKFGVVTNMSKGGLSTVAAQDKSGEWHVKSGFFSLGDQGIIGLDEIDKVNDPKDLNCLVTVLNDQIQLVSKAGQNDLPFNTRAAVLGAANPGKRGYLNKDEIMEQLEVTIPSYITQRFDLIFVVRDIPEKEKDRIVAKSINSIHSDPKINRKNIERVVATGLLRKYILYARTKPVPVFAPSAQQLIEDYYLKLRALPSNAPVIGARQVNNINRLSRAVARREMAPKISEEHVKYAIGLMKAALSTLNDEHEYGIYNYGRTKSHAEKIKLIKETIIEICKKESSAKVESIAFHSGLDTVLVEHTLILMEKAREVFKSRGGFRVS